MPAMPCAACLPATPRSQAAVHARLYEDRAPDGSGVQQQAGGASESEVSLTAEAAAGAGAGAGAAVTSRGEAVASRGAGQPGKQPKGKGAHPSPPSSSSHSHSHLRSVLGETSSSRSSTSSRCVWMPVCPSSLGRDTALATEAQDVTPAAADTPPPAGTREHMQQQQQQQQQPRQQQRPVPLSAFESYAPGLMARLSVGSALSSDNHGTASSLATEDSVNHLLVLPGLQLAATATTGPPGYSPTGGGADGTSGSSADLQETRLSRRAGSMAGAAPEAATGSGSGRHPSSGGLSQPEVAAGGAGSPGAGAGAGAGLLMRRSVSLVSVLCPGTGTWDSGSGSSHGSPAGRLIHSTHSGGGRMGSAGGALSPALGELPESRPAASMDPNPKPQVDHAATARAMPLMGPPPPVWPRPPEQSLQEAVAGRLAGVEADVGAGLRSRPLVFRSGRRAGQGQGGEGAEVDVACAAWAPEPNGGPLASHVSGSESSGVCTPGHSENPHSESPCSQRVTALLQPPNS